MKTNQTELQAIASARTQYRAAFISMARGGNWDLFLGSCGVVLDRAFAHQCVLVRDVQCVTEDTMVIKLSAMLRTIGVPE